MNAIETVTVYAGSGRGRPGDVRVAYDLGRHLAGHGYAVLFGGGREGMMGALADGVLEQGGQIRSVLIPKFLSVAHPGVTDVEVVPTLWDRKRFLVEGGQASLALPGGIGTLDELCEMLSLAQLKIRNQPILLLDHADFFRPFIAMIEWAIRSGFVREEDRSLCQPVARIEEVAETLRCWVPPAIPDKQA